MAIDEKYGKLKYNFQTFTFRDEGSIKFPKTGTNDQFGRDNCYELAVDIIVVSTTQEPYRNFKSTPAHGFFGYASIVTQDCLLEPIPLKFARQRIYQEKIVEAYQTWQDLAVYLANTKKWFELLESVITKGEADNPPVKNICEIEAYRAKWTELSIREVYVELPKNSEFRIELAWVSPESFTDSCGESQDGKSKQPDDPKKDGGLPKNGTQPKNNPPSNPFGGNPPNNGSINDPRFSNPITSLDDPDPSNSAPEEPTEFWVRLRTEVRFFSLGCNVQRVEDYYYPMPYDGVVSLRLVQRVPTGCNEKEASVYEAFMALGGEVVGTSGATDSNLVAVFYGNGDIPPSKLTDTPD